MAPTIPGVNAASFFPVLDQVMFWTGIGLIVIIAVLIVLSLFYFLSFNYKVTIFPLYGSGKDGQFSFSKPKKNRIRWVDKRSAWKTMFPLFNKKKREPFDSEYIYPGKNIYAFELNDELIPIRININKDEKQIRGELNPLPADVRRWILTELEENEKEFAKTGFWEENKQVFITIATVLFCCILCGAVIYFTYEYAMGGRADINALSSAINNIAARGGGSIPA